LIPHEILEEDADAVAQVAGSDVAQIDSTVEDPASRRLVEAQDQLDEGRLRRAVVSDQRQLLAGLDAPGLLRRWFYAHRAEARVADVIACSPTCVLCTRATNAAIHST